MKSSKLTLAVLCASAFISGATIQAFAQQVLPEITVTASNYKYLNAVNPEEAAQPVNMVEHYMAAYDLKGAEFYEEEYDNYVVSFFIPEGKILAAYDKEGNLLRTAEKFKDVAVPNQIKQAVAKRFPHWAITKDVYIVSYYSKTGIYKKLYKLLLENGDKRMRVKLADSGEFL